MFVGYSTCILPDLFIILFFYLGGGGGGGGFTILDKLNRKLTPPLCPKSKMGKWHVLVLDVEGRGISVPL